MALDAPALLFFSVIDLLKGSLILAIPLFIFILAGKFLREKISGRTGWKWLPSALASTFIIVWFTILFLYFSPILSSLQEQSVGTIPSVFAPSLPAILASYAFGLAKVAFSAGVLSLILMPFELIGLYIFEDVSSRLPQAPEWVRLLLTTYFSAVASSAIFLFIIPEAIAGIFFFIFYG